jgi:hypothetical protein
MQAGEALILENERLGLSFDRESGALVALRNKLTGQIYHVSDDAFAVEAEGLRADFSNSRLISLELQRESLNVRYSSGDMRIDVTYTLHQGRCFAEKQMALTCDRGYGLKMVVISRPLFSAPGLTTVCYRYPKFDLIQSHDSGAKRPAGTEPIRTYLGRTAEGGFFTGVELPFDASSLKGNQIVLAYAPSLKVRPGEKFRCEPAYLGVYQRQPADLATSSRPSARSGDRKGRTASSVKDASAEQAEVLPLPSESDAMVSMTSAILGPPRHGLVPMACGWHSEMEQHTYASAEGVEGDMRSVDFLAECGIDWLSDSHPWDGETEKMNRLVGDQEYEPGQSVRKFLDHARARGVKIVMWPTMNNTHPWSPLGKPFRPDRPDWLRVPGPLARTNDLIRNAKANCLANAPFFEWLTRINMQGLATSYYKSWAMDGSFFGDGGWYTTTIPVDCLSDKHDHLPGDSNYGCERALNRLISTVRKQYPVMYIFMCRPPMDLGVWSLRNVDTCFTLLELGPARTNVAAGDEIRTWSRIRVHHHFFPHYLDQPLLFPSRADRNAPRNWPSGKLDYILLSALSCSPNQLYYMPTKTGIPDKDKLEIRRWLDWGRENVAYLKTRKDLPGWPGIGRVDGSAHVVGDRGLIFLFNPEKGFRSGEFALTEQGIGLRARGVFKVVQEYPASSRSVESRNGQIVRWEVPGESAVILKVQPAE